MKSTLIVVAMLAMVVLAIIGTIKLEGPHAPLPETSTDTASEDPRTPAISADAKLQADRKVINDEQDRQADRCKNGYSEGCDKDRAISEFKRATGQ